MEGATSTRTRWLPWLPVALVFAAAALLIPARSSSRSSHEVPSDGSAADTDPPAHVGPTLAGLETPGPRVEVPSPDVVVDAAPGRSEIAVSGVVRDERGRVAVGVALTLRRAGWTATQNVSDGQGRYRLEAGPRPDRPGAVVTVEALAADGRAGSVSEALWSGSPATQELAPIVLGRGGGARVRVVQQGKPVAGARVVAARMASDRWTLTREASSAADGTVRFDGLAPGTYRLLASGGAGGRASGWVSVPHETETVTLDLPATARSVVIRTVEHGTGKPVADARIELHEDTSTVSGVGWHARYEPQPLVAPTDAQGMTRIDGLDPGARLVLIVRAEGYAPPSENPHTRQLDARPPGAAAAAELRYELLARRELLWPIAPGEVPAPADGVALKVEGAGGSDAFSQVPDEPEGRVRDAHVVVSAYAPDWFWGVAVAPDGARGALLRKPGATEGEPVVFRKPRRARVRLVLEDGTPVAGRAVRIGSDAPLAWGPVVSGADGIADLEGLWGTRHRVYVGLPAGDRRWASDDPGGEVDVEAGDADIQITLPRTRRLVLRATIDGQPGLPASLHVYAGGSMVEFERDDEAGTLSFPVVPFGRQATVHVRVSAEGYAPVELKVPHEAGEEVLRRDVSFRRLGELVVRVRPPFDGRFAVHVQVFDEVAGTWRATGHYAQRGAEGPTTLVVAQVQPGRLRVLDALSGVSSADVLLGDPREAPTVLLDLRTVVEVEGRVEAPDGTRMDQVQAVVEGRSPAWSSAPPPPPGSPGAAMVAGDVPLYVDPQGVFRVRAARGQPTWVRVKHPLLAPEADGGRVEVMGAVPPVVVRLVEGAGCMFTLDPPAHVDVARGVKARVLLYRDAPQGAPLSEHALEIDGTRLRFGGFEPGVYTLWIDAPPHAPLVRTGVALGAGTTDLGGLPADPGLSVRVTLIPAEGQPAPKINVAIHRDEAPKLFRSVHAQDAGRPVSLSGLPAGRLRLQVSLARTGESVLDESIDLVPPGPLERTVDLRRR